MTETTGFLDRGDGVRLAWRALEGEGPTVVWLGGYMSDMTGTKAEALAEWAKAKGRAYLRFDYSGHGCSEGVFADCTITQWREDCLRTLGLVEGSLVLVGSSMGGWLACLVAMAVPERVKAMILIAPAADFTEKLSPPPGAPHALAEDGARWSILQGRVPIEAPVRILQGGQDPDVPWPHALELANQLAAEDVVFTLVKDGDHRLSRPQDIERLVAALEDVL